MRKYWIEYTNGHIVKFEAPTAEAALHYFRMEGDRAYNYGPLDEEVSDDSNVSTHAKSVRQERRART